MLYITSGKPVRDMQQEFSQAFPYLKIDFFTKGNAAKKNIFTDQFLSLKQKPGADNTGIMLTPSLTIKELERRCEELFGVSVKVYRRFNNLWLETSITENFTLQQQNDHVSEILSLNIQ